MSLECYPYSSEMRELTGRLKRADISRELDARVERDGVSVVVVEVRDAQNGSCVGADRAGPPDAPGVRASDRTPRPSYSVSKAMLRAAAARADPLGYDRDRDLLARSPRSSAASSPGSDGETRDDEDRRRRGPPIPSRRPARDRDRDDRDDRDRDPADRDPSDPPDRDPTSPFASLPLHRRRRRPVVMSKAALEHLSAPKMPVGAGDADGYDGTDPREYRAAVLLEASRERERMARKTRGLERWAGKRREAMREWRAGRDAAASAAEEEEAALERERRRYARELNKYVANRAAQDVRGFVAKRGDAAARAARIRARAFAARGKRLVERGSEDEREPPGR